MKRTETLFSAFQKNPVEHKDLKASIEHFLHSQQELN